MRQYAIDVYFSYEILLHSLIKLRLRNIFLTYTRVTNDALYSFKATTIPVRLTFPSCPASMGSRAKKMVQATRTVSKVSLERDLGYSLQSVLSQLDCTPRLCALSLTALVILRIADFDISKVSLYEISTYPYRILGAVGRQ